MRLYYPVYTGTMEARALSLMAQKMTAAQLLYGDDVEGALVDESVGAGSLALQLLAVLEREEAGGADAPRHEMRATSIFGAVDDFSHSPVGSLSQRSPDLDPIAAYLRAQGLNLAALAEMNRRARREVFASAQLGLF